MTVDSEGAAAPASSGRRPRRSIAARFFGYDMFISFALGPPPRGTHSYASDLARRLRERDFTVFFSEDEAPPGEQLDRTLRDALYHSKILIVIVNRGTLAEPRWVRTEVEEFRSRHPDRPVIPISAGGALQDPSLATDTQAWLSHEKKIWLDESDQAITNGIASETLVERLALAPTRLRSNVRWRWVVRGVIAGLLMLTTTSIVAACFAVRQANIADSRRLAGLAAEKLRVLASDRLPDDESKSSTDQLRDNQLDVALLLAIHSYHTAPTYEARNTLLTAIAAYPSLTTFLHGHDDVVIALAFTSDGKNLLSGSSDKTVLLSDIAIGRPTKQTTFTVPTGRLSSMAFSRDGVTAAFGGDDGTVVIWDVPSAQQKGVPSRKHRAAVSSITFSPDGQTVASGSKDEIILWDVSSGQPMEVRLHGNNMGEVFSMAFSPDRKTLASASGDGNDASQIGEVRLWDVDTRRVRMTIKSRPSQIRALIFSPNGKTLMLGDWDGGVTSWDIVGSKQKKRVFPKRHAHPVVSLAISPCGQTLASGSWDGTVVLWDIATGEPHETPPLKGRTSSVSSLTFSPDGKTLAVGGYDGSIILWDTSRSKEGTLIAPETVTSGSRVTFSPDGKVIASGTEEGTIILWDASSGRETEASPLQGHKRKITSSAFSSDGKSLVSGSEDGTVILWDVASGQQKNGSLTQRHTASVTSVAIAPDGKTLALGSEDGSIVLFDVSGGPQKGTSFKGHSESVYSLAFSPDSKTLVSGSRDNIAKFWDVTSGRAKQQAILDRRTGYAVTSVAFNPNGRSWANWGGRIGGFVERWLTPDTMVALGDGGGRVILWDVASSQPLGPLFKLFDNSIRHIAFRPDGKTLAALSSESVITLLDIDSESWVARACRIANRNLSQNEWSKFIRRRVAYWRTCPGISPGDGAPANAPTTAGWRAFWVWSS